VTSQTRAFALCGALAGLLRERLGRVPIHQKQLGAQHGAHARSCLADATRMRCPLRSKADLIAASLAAIDPPLFLDPQSRRARKEDRWPSIPESKASGGSRTRRWMASCARSSSVAP
jgi:hypothetical protein